MAELDGEGVSAAAVASLVSLNSGEIGSVRLPPPPPPPCGPPY
jgi:hypothetical protein